MQLNDSNQQLVLKPATDKDKAFFWQLYCTSMRSHIEQIWGWDEQWQDTDFRVRWLNCDNLLVYYDSDPIGYFQTQSLDDEYYIMMLIIQPEYRSKGIGQQLLQHIKNVSKFKSLGLRVFKTNVDACRFYQREGFIEVAEEEHFYYLRQKK